MVDAIVRTLVRLLVTRKHLLEWQTAAQVKADRGPDLRGFYRQMAGSVGLAAGIGVLGVIAQAGRGVDRRPVRRAVARRAVDRAPDQPSRRGLGTGELVRSGRRRAASRSPGARGCSSRRSSAPTNTGCRPTTSRTIRNRWSPIARRPPTSACTCWPPSAPATSDGSAPSTWSNGSRRRWPPSLDSNDSTAISTTGTTRRRCNGWSPSTCRRSTAATSPAICSPCPTPVA